MNLLFAILLFAGVLVWDVLTDYSKWLKAKSIEHNKEAWLRVLLLIPSIFLFIKSHPNTGHWTAYAGTLAMVGFGFWLLFDGFYNLLRGFGWWFTGSEEEDDAETDNFLQSIPLWLHIVIKIGGLAGSIFVYCYNQSLWN